MEKKANLNFINAGGCGQLNMDMNQCMNLRIDKPSLLLHSCCGPCSTAVIERLLDDYNITVFYFNPCITDEAEYLIRLENQKKVIDYFNERGAFLTQKINLLEGKYEPEEYFKAVKGFEGEPEGGARCSICFRQRLEEAARKALEGGFDMFGTTLTVSPHKNYPLISSIGREIGEEKGIGFLDMDFKKKAGFQRSIELSKQLGLYRQNYCGCQFSKWFEE